MSKTLAEVRRLTLLVEAQERQIMAQHEALQRQSLAEKALVERMYSFVPSAWALKEPPKLSPAAAPKPGRPQPRSSAAADGKPLAAPTLHYFPLSQPSRSVMLLLKAGGVEYDAVPVNIMKGEKVKPNPLGGVPYLQDAAFGLELGEGMAIMIHMCETRSAALGRFYPADPKARALCHYYMHWHHTGSRSSTALLRALLGDDVAAQEAAVYTVLPAFLFLEKSLARQGTTFFAGAQLTLADLTLLTEIDQLAPVLSVLFKDGLFPKLDVWRAAIADALPAYPDQGVRMIEGMFAADPSATKLDALKAAIGSKIVGAVNSLTAAEGAAVPSEVDANGDGEVTFLEMRAYLDRVQQEESAALLT